MDGWQNSLDLCILKQFEGVTSFSGSHNIEIFWSKVIWYVTGDLPPYKKNVPFLKTQPCLSILEKL